MRLKTLPFPAFAYLTFFFAGCAAESEDRTTAMLSITDGIESSNSELERYTKFVYDVMEEKLHSPPTQEKAAMVFPKAKAIRDHSRRVILCLDSFLYQKESAQDFDATQKDNAAGTTLLQKAHVQTLATVFLRYADAVRGVAPEVAEFINRNVESPNPLLTSSPKDSFYRHVLRALQSLSAVDRTAFLKHLKNVVLKNENRLVNFLNEQVTDHTHHYDIFEAIVAQNAKVLERGDSLEITAGVGNFDTRQKPVIKINGEAVPLNSWGGAVKKMNLSNKRGTHSVPVQIRYTDRDGKEQERTFNVEYTVVDAIRNQ